MHTNCIYIQYTHAYILSDCIVHQYYCIHSHDYSKSVIVQDFLPFVAIILGHTWVLWLSINWTGQIIVGKLFRKSLNRLHWAMYGCTDGAISLAYKALVRPCMEYGSIVWSPHTAKSIKLLESVQCRAARWNKSKYDSTLYQCSKSIDDCLKELKWPTLASWRLYQSVIMLHSIMNN